MVDTTTQNPLNPPTEKKAGPGIWLSVIVLSVGLGLLSWGAWTGFRNGAELIFVDSFETPGAQVRDLDPGDYEIYGQIAAVDIFEFEVDAEIPLPTLDDITVTQVETGTTLQLTPEFSDENLGRQSNVYAVVASFSVERGGRYEVTVDSPEASRAVFGRTFASFGDRILISVILAVAGLLLTIGGTVMLFIGIIRRKRQTDAKKTAASYGQTPGAYGSPVAPPPPPGSVPTTTSSTDAPAAPSAPPPDQPEWPS